jgi:hypothetical protein
MLSGRSQTTTMEREKGTEIMESKTTWENVRHMETLRRLTEELEEAQKNLEAYWETAKKAGY